MIRTLGPAQGGSSHGPAADPSLSPRSSVQIPPSQTPDSSSAPDPAKAAEVPFLSRDEKRRILAQIVRTNTLDCFDDSGAFDVARARHVLPPGAIRGFVIHETTRTDQEGKATTQRRIHVRLVDPLSALRLDDLLERRADPARHSPATSRASFNALRKRTMEEDDARQSIALLKQALSEADDRELQLSQKLEAQDQQLAAALSSQPSVQTPSSQTLDIVKGSSPNVNVNVIQAASLFPSLPKPRTEIKRPPIQSKGAQPSVQTPPSQTLDTVEGSSPNVNVIQAASLFPSLPKPQTEIKRPPTQSNGSNAPLNSNSPSTLPAKPQKTASSQPPTSRPRPPPSVPNPVPLHRVIPPSLCTVTEF